MAVKKAAKAKKSIYDEILVATGIKSPNKGEGHDEYIMRLCEELDGLADDDYDAMSEEARDWISKAFAAVKEGDVSEIEELEGFPIERPVKKGSKKAAVKAVKAKTAASDPDDEDEAEDDSDEAEDEEGEEGDDDDDGEEEEPTKGKKPTTRPVIARKGKVKAKAVEEDDDDGEDEEEIPKSKVKGKPKPAARKAKAVEEDDDDDGEDEKPAKGKKAKAASAPREKSDSGRFRELVVTNHELGYDALVKKARKAGIKCADSQLARIHRSAMDVMKILIEQEMLTA
jgi:hypothetical protein